ncbi:MAG: B3/B4 domain-containing protein [Gammaproteobacteria bacterium]
MFAYHDAITERYPTIRAGVIHATGLANGPGTPALLDAYRAEQQRVLERLNAIAIADSPSIAAWRRAFKGFGVKPTQYRVAAEALLRRLQKHGNIPSINALVDIGNLVSIRYALPVAVFDQAAIAGFITVRFATGDELFTDLGAANGVSPEPGEVVFVDTDNVVSARRWCWRQSAQSATSASTVDALIVAEGHHDAASEDVASALKDLRSLLAVHQPHSQLESCLLSPARPRSGPFEDETGDP